MKTYFKLLLTVLWLGTASVYAQSFGSYAHVSGLAVKELKPADVEGSPFLSDDWQPGAVTTGKGQGFTNLKLKYDVHNDQILFEGDGGEPMAFADEVSTFTLNKAVYASGFPAIGAHSNKTYYQVLADGKLKLLKHTSKIIEETKAYGSSTSSRSFRKIDTYFVFQGDRIAPVKADKKSIMALFADKAAQVNAYADSHKINYKSDKDLGDLVAYYNSL